MTKVLICYSMRTKTDSTVINGHCYFNLVGLTEECLRDAQLKVKEAALKEPNLDSRLREPSIWQDVIFTSVTKLEG